MQMQMQMHRPHRPRASAEMLGYACMLLGVVSLLALGTWMKQNTADVNESAMRHLRNDAMESMLLVEGAGHGNHHPAHVAHTFTRSEPFEFQGHENVSLFGGLVGLGSEAEADVDGRDEERSSAGRNTSAPSFSFEEAPPLKQKTKGFPEMYNTSAMQHSSWESDAAAEPFPFDTYKNVWGTRGDHYQSQPRQKQVKNFLIFFSGHQGSSWLSDLLGSMPEVYVPGFEPLEVENATANQKVDFINMTFNLPSSEDDHRVWLQDIFSLSESAGFRLYKDKLPTYEEILETKASGFKVRPYWGKHTGFRDLNLYKVKQLLDDHNVSIILTTRYNTLKSAISWYRARENGLNQFQLTRSADFDQAQKIRFEYEKFQKWLKFVEDTDKALQDSVSFFQRPTLTVAYEHLRKDPVTTVKQVAHFLQIDEKAVMSSGRFRKTGSDSLRRMILNFEEFCDYYWQSPYQSMLGVESCVQEARNASRLERQGNASFLYSDSVRHLVTYPNASNPKDCFASGWAQFDTCTQRMFQSKLGAVLRARRRQVPIFFKHIHKAGGTTLCSVASANVFVETRSLPHVDKWGTDCVPYEVFLSRPSEGLVANSLMKLQAVDSDRLTSHSGWMGGACFWGHLTPSAQHALPQAFPSLGFLASEGPMPDELALNLDYPLVTMMRDPFDRIVSAYKWWKFMVDRFPGTRGSICSTYTAPANATLSEWIDYYPDNWVTRSLLGAHYLYNFKSPLGWWDLQGAMNRLESFSAVLILEEYETSMLLMQELFGWSKTGSGVEVNVSPGGRSNSGEELDDLTRLKISKTIQHDLPLYEFAHSLFWRHARQLGVTGTENGGADEHAVGYRNKSK